MDRPVHSTDPEGCPVLMWLVTIQDNKGMYSVTRWATESMALEYVRYIRPTLTSDQRLTYRNGA